MGVAVIFVLSAQMTANSDLNLKQIIYNNESSLLGSSQPLDISEDKNVNQDSDSSDSTSVTAIDGRCGFGACRPRWLNVFAKPIWFMIVLNTYCFVEGTIVSGKQ